MHIDYILLQKYSKAWKDCHSIGVMLARLKTLKRTTLTKDDHVDVVRQELVTTLASDKKRITYMQQQGFLNI